MKKKSCLMLAVMLAMLQIIAVFAVVPASAAGLDRSYDAYKTDATITVDANPTEWDNVPWSESFVYGNTNGSSAKFNSTVNAAYKMLWKESATEGKIDVYFMIKIEGYNTSATSKLFQIRMKDGTTEYATSSMALNAGDVANTVVNKTTWTYNYAVDVQDNATAILEVNITIDKTTSNAVGLDIYYLEYADWTYFMGYTWDGDAHSVASGTVNLNDTTEIPTNPLAGVSVTAANGASIRLDTSDKTKSGIRFATTVVVPAGATIKKTGTLILPTATLTSKKIVDAAFNHASLTAAGLVEGTDYYDIENVGNKWVEGETGNTWYGTLYDIKQANFGRAISGIGYAVVEIGGVEYTVYAEYDSAAHSRSITQVAQNALGLYQPDTDEYDLLVEFGAVAEG